ncbi:MAG: hypothetical protein HUN04_15910 [Desulfobacter sp.]|nr:MAG: hypothetical protein HUN04_15910 [Desulfobacter sp.]
MTETQEEFEVLTTEEFMERMKIGRTTVHKWKKTGILVPGKHYTQAGHVVRFIWTKEILLDLCDRNIMKVGSTEKKPPAKRKKPVSKRPHGGGINLDY